MNWEQRLSVYNGKKLEIIIEDKAGYDPAAPLATRTLHHVRLNDEQTHLQFYFNDIQFLAIPVHDDARTLLEETDRELMFSSHDEQAQLIYKLRLS